MKQPKIGLPKSNVETTSSDSQLGDGSQLTAQYWGVQQGLYLTFKLEPMETVRLDEVSLWVINSRKHRSAKENNSEMWKEKSMPLSWENIICM